MKQNLCMSIVTVALLCLAAGARAAEEVPGPSVDLVSITDMKGWKIINQGTPQGRRSTTWIPEDEKPRDWSQMVNLLAIETGKPVAAEPVIQAFIRKFGTGCAKFEVVAHGLKQETDVLRQSLGLPSSYPAYTALLHCEGSPPYPDPDVTLKKHEVTWIKVMSGQQNLFMIQKSWHGDEIGPDNVLVSDKTRQEWQGWMDKILVSSRPINSQPPKN